LIDHLIRAESRSVWLTYAQDWGWIDADDNPTPGILIDEIGSVVLVPSVIDEDMTVTTEAVMDDWHHVNVRVLDDQLEEKGALLSDAKMVTTDPEGIDALEIGVEPTRIQILDASDITTPVRVWADGMHFPVSLAKPAAAEPKAKAKKAKAKKR
jgi:hypothetical protein